jgi:two-component system, cell cycle sensor histidine kinase and response regulator CckA
VASEDFTDALRESEERYRTLFEQAPFGVFLYSRELRITECNAAFVKILGAPYEKLIGLDLRRLRDQGVVPAIEGVLEGEPSSYEGPYTATISGWTIYVHLRCTPLRDMEGDIVGGIGIVEDITERNRVLEALRASEQRLSLHVKSSPLGVVGWNVEGKCVEWNDSAARIFGYTATEMLGQGPEKIVPERSRKQVFSIAERLMHRVGGERSVNENLTKDGRVIVCDWYNTALVDPHGNVIGIASLVQDITERTHAEEALKRSEARFRELIERAPEAIGVSRDGVWLYANPALVTYLGYQRANELVGTPALDRIHLDDRERFVGQHTAREVRLLRRDESIVFAEVVSMTVDYDGAPALLTFLRDLSERKQMQVRLLQADRLASVGTLAAGVAHEINNPLAYLLANLEHMSQRKLPAFVEKLGQLAEEFPEARAQLNELRTTMMDCGEMLQIAREGAHRVRTIVADLKTFSRGDEERHGPVDVHRVLDAAINMAWNEIRHSAQLVRDYGDVPLLDANEARLGQVFLNLLVNAAQSIPAGHALQNEIRVRTSTDARGVRVEVSDTGCGIARDSIPRIFDPFYTTKPEGVGTGLGLWICQGIVASLGGAITVESEIGRGTTFVISLPVPETPADDDTRDAREELPSKRGRILVVDDEPAISRALRDGLGDAHDVVIAVSGREALALLLGDDPGHFDVILCDVMMPDLDGVELYEALRAKRPELAERVVFVTGGAFAAHAREFIAKASVPTLEKPFEIDRVRALIQKRMGQ